MPIYISPPPQSPLTRIIGAILAVFVLAGALMLGMAALLVIGGIALVAGLVLWLRIAWIRRRLRKHGAVPGDTANSGNISGQVIDAEYTVISKREE